ncbi:hypothetical protein LZC95_44230 [Pendulispora brunnea]|uniref:Lipoprotein n=1 Tax=Pendulispora brunnea TaxID=2905690 RepID=A0ABZ2K423_9BACT
MARSRSRLHRAVIFGGIAFAVPLAACKWLSKDDEADAGPPAASGAVPAATVTPSATATPAPAASPVAPLTSGSASGGSRRVVVKLPDGGTAMIDAAVGADGGVVLPPGFQWPTIPGFDAAALKIPPFDAASLPPFPSSLPSAFPKIPGFGGDGGK